MPYAQAACASCHSRCKCRTLRVPFRAFLSPALHRTALHCLLWLWAVACLTTRLLCLGCHHLIIICAGMHAPCSASHPVLPAGPAEWPAVLLACAKASTVKLRLGIPDPRLGWTTRFEFLHFASIIRIATAACLSNRCGHAVNGVLTTYATTLGGGGCAIVATHHCRRGICLVHHITSCLRPSTLCTDFARGEDEIRAGHLPAKGNASLTEPSWALRLWPHRQGRAGFGGQHARRQLNRRAPFAAHAGRH